MADHIFNVTNSGERGVAHALLDDFSAGARAATGWASEVACVDALYEFSSSSLPSPQNRSLPSSPGLYLTPCTMPLCLQERSVLTSCREGNASENASMLCSTSPSYGARFRRSAYLGSWFCRGLPTMQSGSPTVLALFKNYPVKEGGLRTYAMSRSYWEQESHDYLRAFALLRMLRNEELSAKDLFPRKKEGSGYDYERDRAMSTAGKVLPAYILRAKALRSNWNAQRAWRVVKKSLSAWRSSAQRRDERYQPFFRTYALHIVDTMVLLAGSCSDFVDELLARGEAVLYPTEFAAFCMDMAEKCAHRSEYFGAAQDLGMRAVKAAGEHPMKARERGALLLRASSLLEAAEADLTADLVGEALSAAQAVDEDAPYYARLWADLRSSRVKDMKLGRRLTQSLCGRLLVHWIFVRKTRMPLTGEWPWRV